MDKKIIDKIVNDIDKEKIDGIALMGSYSLGEEKEFSDVDIVVFSNNPIKIETQFVDSKLVVISNINHQTIRDTFAKPEVATEVLFGIKNMNILWDPNQILKNLKEKARQFVWTDQFQDKANKYAIRELILLIEEVHKGLQSISSNEIGRALNCIFGLSFGIGKIIRTQKRIFLRSDNNVYKQIIECYKHDSELLSHFRNVFGVDKAELQDRVKSGLVIYREISSELYSIMEEEDRIMISQTNTRINETLENKTTPNNM